MTTPRKTDGPRLLVLGAAGMLGHKLFQILRERFPGTRATTLEDVRKPPFDRVEFLQGDDVIRGVNAADFPSLRNLLGDLKPDYVLNCVGIIKQRDAATSPIPSITINALLPHQIAAMIKPWGGRLVHFSTDCVFDGRRGGYTEDDPCSADDLYGLSKFLGEAASPNAITLRTSIVGRELVEHKSLLDWFLSQNGKKVRGFRRVIYAGITTNQMAEVVTHILRRRPDLNGLYQVVSSPISKHDLLVLIRDAFRLDIDLSPDDSVVSDRSMKGDRLREAAGYVSPPWPELVKNLASDPTPYERWVAFP